MSLKQFVKQFTDERWTIGFIRNSLDSILSGEQLVVDWVRHNITDAWFADPFILDVTADEIQVLVEEFPKALHRGRISKLTIDRASLQLKQVDVIKELPTHMSFPVVIRSNEDFVYLLPENGEAGQLTLYKFYPADNRIETLASVLDEEVKDATPFQVGDQQFLFCTRRPNINGNLLSLYQWDESLKKYAFVKEYRFDENLARMAGDCFAHNGKYYRPAQECNVQYGHAVSLQEVTCGGESLSTISSLNPEQLTFKEIRRMYSPHPKLNIGMHTFNMYKGYIVTDALGFDNMWLRKLIACIRPR